jgi:hypothetical protein
MEIKHFPPQGQSLIAGKHTTNGKICQCDPTRTLVTKRSSTGRFGKHQGREVIRVEYRHNFIDADRGVVL